MRDILKATRAARRKLVAIEFTRHLFVAVFWAVLAAAVLVGIHRWVAPVPGPAWLGLGVAALAAAAVGTALNRPTLRTAALALDRAADLKERVTAALYVRDDGSPAAQAVLRDAGEAVRKARDKGVPFVRPRLRPLALSAAILLAVLFVPIHPASSSGSDDPDSPEEAIVPETVRKEQSSLMRRRAYNLETRARQMEQPSLKELADAMRKVASELRKETTRNEALAKISSLEEKMRKQREEQASKFSDSLLKRLKESGDGDAKEGNDEIAKKLSKLSRLGRALKNMKAKLESGEATPEEAKKLKEKLEELARDLGDDGIDDGKLDEMLENLEDLADADDLEDLEDLEDWLGEVGEFMGDWEDMLEDFEMWDLLGDELAELLEGKECFCEGGGVCAFCGGGVMSGEHVCSMCEGLFGGGEGRGPGAGFGSGPGPGPTGHSNEEDERVPTKVKGPIHPGDIIGAIRFKSLPQRGTVRTGYTSVYRHMAAEAAEALQQEEIPPGYRLHVRDYFDSIRPDKEK